MLLYKRLLQYVKPYWKTVIVMLIATGVFSSTNAIYASKLKVIIDEGFIEKDMQAIYVTIGVLMLVTVVRGIGLFVSNYTSRRISSDIVLCLRKDMFAHLQCLPTSYYDRVNSGETLSRFNYDVLQVTDAATDAAITLVREGVLVIVLLSYLLYQNWKLTLIIFALAPIIGLIVNVISKRLRVLAERIQGNMGNMNHILDENLKGQKIVKIYAGAESEQRRFRQATEHIRNASIKSEVATSISTPVIEIMIVAVISLIIWLMAKEAKVGALTPGEFLSYTIMIGLLPSPIKKLMRINEALQRGLAASQDIFAYLDERVERSLSQSQDNDNSQRSMAPDGGGSVRGEIVFRDVTFAYEQSPDTILESFNLHINAGETVALVGMSGSGKSSIASLIPRFYDIQAGSILLDGNNIAQMDLAHLRKHIAFVNQETVLFDDSVTNNIAYGDPHPDRQRVQLAAQLAQAQSFIDAMEHGYDSRIGEAGQRLSGGQKQRLAIARALYKDAPVLIFDEATSALDSNSEHLVQKALDELLKDRTAIIIAHRLSTVRNADRIVVLEHGRIVESGSYDELMDNQGSFFQLNAVLSHTS